MRTSTYRQNVKARPNARYRRGPYKRRYAGGVPRMPSSLLAVVGGVPGGAQRMSGTATVKPEVKYYDVGVATANVVDWNFLQSGSLGGIQQGTGPNARLGKEIRLVGIVYRFSVQSGTYTLLPTATAAIGVTPAAYTIDIILDKQAAASAAVTYGAIGAIYDSPQVYNLPNPEAQDRFQFLRRIEVKDPQAVDTTVSGFLRINKNITYNNNTGSFADLQTNSLHITTASTAKVGIQSNTVLPYRVTGIVRYLFVDS